MGLAIDREDFSAKEFEDFSARLHECLTALKYVIQQENFDTSPLKIGAELENYIVDDSGLVLARNTEIIDKIADPRYTIELNRFNLEVNFDPLDLRGQVFTRLQRDFEASYHQVNQCAIEFGGRVVSTGILPTLRHEDLKAESMTDFMRYRALSKRLRMMRGEDFVVDISGEDSIKLCCDHVVLEGANTSLQYHLMVSKDEFADVFNACQLVSSVMVAISANSPILLNNILWDETRICLFKQSIDSRARNSFDWNQPARVSFGHGWVRESAWELFAETVALYTPIFPILSNEQPLDMIERGLIPNLSELSVHVGTTWPWNRPVYSAENGGHIRIEMRALPAGPSTVDMVANLALFTGLVMGLKGGIRDLIAVMPFKFAEYNFYRTAQKGLDAKIIWPQTKKHQLMESPVVDVLAALLPVAEHGLKSLNISEADIRYYLGIISKRIEKKASGARWQKAQLKSFEVKNNRQEACRLMFENYVRNQSENRPVSEWLVE